MTKTIITIVIFLIILLIILMPVGASFVKKGDLINLKINVGLFRFSLLPKTEKSPKHNKQEKKKSKQKNDGKKSFSIPKIGIDDICIFLNILKKIFYRLWKAFRVDKFYLFFHIGGANEPFDAVKNYSRLNALVGALLPQIHSIISVKDESIESEVDFEEYESDVDIEAIVHFSFGRLLYLSVAALVSILVWFIRRKVSDKKLKSIETIE